jgi:uncharacterized lipoprotein YajG
MSLGNARWENSQRIRLLPCVAAIFLGSLLLTGCGAAHVDLSYAPQAGVTRISGSDAVIVRVEVSDRRGRNDNFVEYGENGVGMKTPKIVANEDLSETVKKAIEAELTDRGFSLGKDSVLIAVELTNFMNDLTMGTWTGTAEAHVAMNVMVRRPGGTVVFSKQIDGRGITKVANFACSISSKSPKP